MGPFKRRMLKATDSSGVAAGQRIDGAVDDCVYFRAVLRDLTGGGTRWNVAQIVRADPDRIQGVRIRAGPVRRLKLCDLAGRPDEIDLARGVVERGAGLTAAVCTLGAGEKAGGKRRRSRIEREVLPPDVAVAELSVDVPNGSPRGYPVQSKSSIRLCSQLYLYRHARK
jgi:hypothetical protein